MRVDNGGREPTVVAEDYPADAHTIWTAIEITAGSSLSATYLTGRE
jgi:hypothetical protein